MNDNVVVMYVNLRVERILTDQQRDFGTSQTETTKGEKRAKGRIHPPANSNMN